MVTHEQIYKFSPEERDAWEASLSADEIVILKSAPGYRYTIAAIAEVKWYLAQNIPADIRLRLLQFLERQTDMFSADAIALVEPMPDEGREILREARKLGKKWLDVVARWEVFNTLAQICPTIVDALKARSSRINGAHV